MLRRSFTSKAPLQLFHNVIHHRPRITPLSVAFTTTAIAATATKHSTFCSSSRAPPQFGKHIPNHLIQSRSLTTHIPKDNPKESILSISKDERDECPLCKKYSKGPCGKLFQKWIECIDTEEDERKCDSLVVPLDECLKQHQDHYDKISIYDDDNDQETIDKWRDFIVEIELEDGIQSEPFEGNHVPEMQLRPVSNMGAAMFLPKIADKVLLLAYIKDQDGNLLGAGSVENLLPFQDQYVLRFSVSDECKDITAHAVYGYEEGSHDNVTIYTKTERVPPS